MKTLKESILSRSSHSGETFKTQRRVMIEKWLKEYNINNYTINDDLTIDVRGDVDIYAMSSKEFPEYIQFDIVKGDFYCNHNRLTSLKGAPSKVEGSFYCSYNQLTSLEGAPKEIRKDFYCNNNQLTSLEGAPKEVGESFDCRNNKVSFTENDVRRVCNVKGVVRIK